jgi:hypothetical protein
MKGHVEKTQIAAQVEVGKVQQKHTQVVGETGGRGGTYWDTSSLLFPYAISEFSFLMEIYSHTVCVSH